MNKQSMNDMYAVLIMTLREVRGERGLRQVDLAEILGQHQSFVSKYEIGERHLDLIETREICRALGIPFSEFISRFEDAINEA